MFSYMWKDFAIAIAATSQSPIGNVSLIMEECNRLVRLSQSLIGNVSQLILSALVPIISLFSSIFNPFFVKKSVDLGKLFFLESAYFLRFFNLVNYVNRSTDFLSHFLWILSFFAEFKVIKHTLELLFMRVLRSTDFFADTD